MIFKNRKIFEISEVSEIFNKNFLFVCLAFSESWFVYTSPNTFLDISRSRGVWRSEGDKYWQIIYQHKFWNIAKQAQNQFIPINTPYTFQDLLTSKKLLLQHRPHLFEKKCFALDRGRQKMLAKDIFCIVENFKNYFLPPSKARFWGTFSSQTGVGIIIHQWPVHL